MTSYEVDDEIVRSLEDIAQAENRSAIELVNDALLPFTRTRLHRVKKLHESDKVRDTEAGLLRILQGADTLGIRSSEDNISERSRETLATDYRDFSLFKPSHCQYLELLP